MEGILNLLRKLGYSENEIKTVLNKVPVEEQGLMGTNVATGIFSKPKEGKLAKDFLVSDVIGNPFEIDYYKGRSREDILKSAEAQLNMINDELLKVSYQIVNKNLKLTDDQLRNFSKNLEAKRRFEKDFEAFKTKPEAEVLNIETGKKVEDIETLKEKSGLIAPPTTDLGRIDLRNKQMLQKADEFFKSQEEVEKAEAKRQALIAKQYEGKGYAGGTFGPSGMYRSVARDFLLDQNAKGKIKLTDDVIKNLEERNYISGGQPLMYPDPIRVMRFHYGDDVFEKIPLDKIPTGARSEIIDAMSKVEAKPVKAESPKTPGGYMTPGEIQANIEELENIERMIKRRESRFADMTDQEIKNELEHYGSQKNAFEIAFGYDHPEAYEQYIKSKPEKKAEGGPMGLDYLTGMEPPKNGYAGGGRVNFEKGTVPRMLKFLIDKLADEKNFNKTLLEKSNPKAIQELYIEQYGKLPSAEEIKDIVNKQLQNKGSMETVNPKTGEVTTPKEPVTIADKKRQLTKEEIEDYEEAIGRNSEEWLSEGTLEEAEKALKRSKGEEAYYRTQYKLGKLDPEPGEQTEARMKFLQKKMEEASEVKDRRLITPKEVEELMELESRFIYKKGDSITEENFGSSPFAPSQETLDNLKKAREMTKEISLQDEMNMVLNQYDKSMFVKNEQGMVDVANPENVQKMALLLKRDHPELYRRLEGGAQTETPVIKNRALDSFLKVLNTDRSELERIQQKYTGVIDDSFLKAILLDPNPQSRAEIMAKIDEALIMQQKGMSGEEIINILDKTKRTKQAQGGPIGLNYLMGL